MSRGSELEIHQARLMVIQQLIVKIVKSSRSRASIEMASISEERSCNNPGESVEAYRHLRKLALRSTPLRDGRNLSFQLAGAGN